MDPTKKKKKERKEKIALCSIWRGISISTCLKNEFLSFPSSTDQTWLLVKPYSISDSCLSVVDLFSSCWKPLESSLAPYSEISPPLVLLRVCPHLLRRALTWQLLTRILPLKEILLWYFYTSFPSLHFLCTSFAHWSLTERPNFLVFFSPVLYL